MMDNDWELRQQLYREHREGMAADRLEAERSGFGWDIEGWSSTDQLLLYIAGSGLHRIPRVEVVRLANAMLAEHEMHTRESDIFECCAPSPDGFVCTEPSGHAGQHVARQTGGGLCDAWFDDDVRMTCDTCGRYGNADDGIEVGGPCQEPCDGIVRAVNEEGR